LIVYMFVFGNACLKRHVHHVSFRTKKIKFKLPYFHFFMGWRIFIYFSCKENKSNSNTSFILNISYINYIWLLILKLAWELYVYTLTYIKKKISILIFNKSVKLKLRVLCCCALLIIINFEITIWRSKHTTTVII